MEEESPSPTKTVFTRLSHAVTIRSRSNSSNKSIPESEEDEAEIESSRPSHLTHTDARPAPHQTLSPFNRTRTKSLHETSPKLKHPDSPLHNLDFNQSFESVYSIDFLEGQTLGDALQEKVYEKQVQMSPQKLVTEISEQQMQSDILSQYLERASLDKLEEIDADLETLPPETLESYRFDQLGTLELDSNLLTELPSTLSQCTKLWKVSLSGNHFKELPEVILDLP